MILCSFCFSFVVSVNGVDFDLQDFYSKYSKTEWDRAIDQQKKSILEDYIKKESAVIEALGLGYGLDPVVVNRFNNIKKQLLVNLFYDKYVAFPLVDSLDFSLTKKNLKKEVDVKHILISHNQSELSTPNPRTKMAAVELVNEIRQNLVKKPLLFDSLAFKFSDDPGVKKNKGELGWIGWGRTPMSFHSSVWAATPNVVTPAIETQYGYHLAVVKESRVSEFFYYDKDSYDYEAVRRSLVLIRNSLKAASLEYEKSVFLDGGALLYNKSFISLFALLTNYRSNLLPGERFDFVDFLKSIDERLVLCSVNGRFLGVKSFLSEIKKQAPSRVPDFKNTEDLLSYFKILVLRRFVEEEGRSVGLDDSAFFNKRLKVERAKFLYDFYLKDLVNSAPTPDSSSVNQYYLENRDDKYFNSEQVIIRQIRIEKKTLADSLVRVVNVDNFENIASSFSINRKANGGLMEPFERGKYNYMGEEAFSLDVGGVSGVIENPDKTFSIIMLENKIPKKHLPLKKVYKRIESLLLKESQERVKTTTFDRYLNNKQLTLGPEYEKYIN